MRHRILVVADNVKHRSSLARWLISAGYTVELAESERRAREVLANQEFSLTILLRDRAGTPSPELTGNGGKVLLVTEQDTAPFGWSFPSATHYSLVSIDEREVLASVRSILPSPHDGQDGAAAAGEILCFDDYTIDVSGRSLVDSRGNEVPLTRSEFALLLILARHSGRVLSRDQLLDAALGRRAEPYDRSIDVLIGRLRRKIEPDPKAPRLVVTVQGEGYKFAAKLSDKRSRIEPGSGAPAEEARPRASQQSSERRPLTVLSCGLMRSPALASPLDPEDLRAVLAECQRCCTELIGRFGGVVAAFSGDRVLAYFGYPDAHENDAERAVRAALALVEAVPKVALPAASSFRVRVGIASGLVVAVTSAVDPSGDQPVAIGEAPDLAIELQSIAPSDAVVIAASTRDLVRGLFAYREVGQLAREGMAEPAFAWQVVGTSDAESRFEALRDGGLTPLVGRDEEIDLLLRRRQQIQSGEGRLVLISGEPGIGKSRLVRAVQDKLSDAAVLSFYCSPNHQESSLYPVIAHLERAAGFSRDDGAEERLTKLETLVHPSIGKEAAALLAALLSVAGGERYPLPDLSPQLRKQKTLATLVAQLASLAGDRPVLAVFEDAHWIDPTSRELLDAIVDQARNLPVLVLVTYRPDFAPPWTSQANATTLVLNRLGNREMAAMADNVTGKRLPREIHRQIIDLSDGVPLFVEELVKTVLESGLLLERDDDYALQGPVRPLAIPNTLQGLLTARLDRLGLAKEVAQIGSTLGREFPYDVLCAVADWLPEHRLQEALQSLARSEIVYCRGKPPDAIYLFKHALLQDAARETLLRGRRRELHARIAAVLQEQFSEIANQQPELLAHHFTEAGRIEDAVVYWGRAGQRSADRSAGAEAAAQFQRGLEQLALLPDTSERRRQELEFHTSLGAVFAFARGYAAPETGQAYARARGLWDELGSDAEVPQARFGELIYHGVRGELALSLHLAEDLLRRSVERRDSSGIVLGHVSCGGNLCYLGWFVRSRWHLEKALLLYDPISHRSLVYQAGFHPQVRSRAQLALALFCLGCSDQAITLINAATAEARRLTHLPTLANVLGWRTMLSLVSDDPRLGEGGDELAAVATEQGFPQWRAFGTIYRGSTRVKNGDLAEGLSLLRSGSTAFRATGAQVWAPHNMALLARACELGGRIEEALALLDEALQIVDSTGERWFAAELNRQKGQILLRQGDREAAEELYRKARNIAIEQNAKLWELRAAMSLARLWRDQDRRTEARDLLDQVYGQFAEGFETKDLQEAKALLEELEYRR